MAEIFRCDVCKGVFDKGRIDAEAEAEYRRDYGTEAELFPAGSVGAGVVCDECYEKVLKYFKSIGRRVLVPTSKRRL